MLTHIKADSMLAVGSACEAKVPGGWAPGTMASTDSVTLKSSPSGAPVALASSADVRPPPPDHNAMDFVAGLEVETVVEALAQDGVWQPAAFLACKMMRGDGGVRKCQCTVRLHASGEEEVVDETGVRPFLAWEGGAWVAATAPPAQEAKSVAADGDDAMAVDGSAAADGEAAPYVPPPPVMPTIVHPVAVGDAMEVTSLEEGLIGSWYEVKVTKLGSDADAAEGGGEGMAQVQYIKYPDQDLEWVERPRLRPFPPPNPSVPTAAAWTRKLQAGDMVELNYESGWWEVQFLSRAGSTLRVLAVRYGKVHEVSSSALRPGWTCKEGGAWEYGLGGVVKPAEEWAANIAANPARVKAAAKRGGGTAGVDGVDSPRASRHSTGHELHTSDGFFGAGAVSVGGSVAGEPGCELGSFKWGVAVEVMSSEEHLKGCWAPAEVLRVLDNDTKVHISWCADTEPPNATVEVERARPAAPAPPPGWAANVRAGEDVDVYHDGAWWGVTLESKKGSKAKVVDGQDDPLGREVKLTSLRPRYAWHGWEGGWTYNVDGRECVIAPGPAPLQHCTPPTGTEGGAGGTVGQTSKGRTIKPKGADLKAAANAAAAAASLVPLVDPERVPKLGELLEVEVAESEENGGSVDWKPAIVKEVLPRQRFVAMVNGEEDFMEEYGMEDEGKEWRKVPPEELERVQKANDEAIAADKEARRKAEEQERLEAEAAAAAQKAAAGGDSGGGGFSGKAGGAGSKRKSEGGKAGGGGAAASSYRFGFGMEVEVRMRDKGFEGSWYLAEVLSVKDDGACVVQYDALFEAPSADGQPATTPAQETVKADQLRPKPPSSTPENWEAKLMPGQPMELNHEDGWWQVTFQSRLVGTDQILVKSSHWGASYLVQLANLRPGWKWSAANAGAANEWTAKPPPFGGGAAAKSGGGGGGGGSNAASSGGAASGSAGRGGRAAAGRAMGRGRGRGGNKS